MKRCYFKIIIAVTAISLPGGARAQYQELGEAPFWTQPLIPAPDRRHAGALAAGENWIYTSNRQAVRYFYNTVLVPSRSVPMGWTGSVAGCAAGTTSQQFRDAVAARVNWFRSMAGVPPTVVLESARNAKAQDAALMMSANKQLNHDPPANWACYTATGDEAASKSNLCYSYNIPDDAGCVEGYMFDRGANNSAVGHRRWILYPPTSVMGTGDVEQTGSYPGGYPMTNALWVIPDSPAPRPATREEYVAWPPNGYVPYQEVPVRWSFTYPAADFSAATVSMTRNGQAVPVRLEPVQDGYGDNTLVWVPDNMDADTVSDWPRPASDTAIQVTVSGVKIGSEQRNFSYVVRIFDPETAGPAAADGAGVYRDGFWMFDSNKDYRFQIGERTIPFGWEGVTVVTGDWNGDGKTKIGVYSSGYWFLDYDGNGVWDGGVIDKQVGWGWAGALPVTGDWNGDGRTGIGVFSNGFWFLDYNKDFLWDGGVVDRQAGWGWSGATPVLGDWNGSGATKIGVYSNGYWFLDYDGNYIWDGGVVDRQVGWGWIGATPVLGDWNGDGRTKIGVYSSGNWFIDFDGNYLWQYPATDKMGAFGWPGTSPVVGDWNGDGRTDIGVYINGQWYLDLNNNIRWDHTPADAMPLFNSGGGTPLVGKW